MMGVKHIFTPEKDLRLKKLYADGVPLKRIAADLRIGATSARYRLRALGVPSNRRRSDASQAPLITPPEAIQHLHPSEPGVRKCLCCGRSFNSTHAGNRMCLACKYRARRDGSASSYAP